MSDETTTTAAVEEQAPAAEAPKEQAKPDPYANVDPGTRDYLRSVEDALAASSPEEKAAFFQAAQERIREGGKAAPKEEKTEEKPDRLTTVEKELLALRQEREAEKRRAQAIEQEQRYRKAIDDAIAEIPELEGKKSLVATIRKAGIGELIENRPRDLKGAVAAIIAGLKEDGVIPPAKEQPRNVRGEYINQKRADAAATKGETRGGSAATVAERAPTGKDFTSGNLFERFKQRALTG